MSRATDSGIIRFQDGEIHYELPNGGWIVPVSAIRVIGEHTDDQGPYIDDYFLIFLTDCDAFEASFYAEGQEQFLHDLSYFLGVSLSLELANSTDYNSRVIWPPDLTGEPLFDYSRVRRNDGLIATLKDKWFPQISRKLTKPVRNKLTLTSHSSW